MLCELKILQSSLKDDSDKDQGQKATKKTGNHYKMFKKNWFEVVWRNQRKLSEKKKKKKTRLEEENKKNTLRAFASRANKMTCTT